MKNLFQPSKITVYLSYLQKALSLFLAFALLGNEALAAIPVANLPQIVSQKAEEAAAQQTLSPAAFLQHTRAAFETALTDGAAAPSALSQKEYDEQFAKETEAFYRNQEKEINRLVTKALAEFEEQMELERSKVWAGFLHDDANAAEKLATFEAYARQERAKYEQLLQEKKKEAFQQLIKEKKHAFSQKRTAYLNYKKAYEDSLRESQKAATAFYKDLVHQTVLNYQKVLAQTQPSARNVKQALSPQAKKQFATRHQAEEDFLSIVSYLTTMSNSDELFSAEDKAFTLGELWKHFTVKSNACAGYIETHKDVYVANNGGMGNGLMGGSPSASHMATTQVTTTYSFELVNARACNMAISSILPFAALGGEGYKITNFMGANVNNPIFGQILLVGAKGLLLTKNGGLKALDAFVDKAIELENKGRKKTFWQTLDIATAEGAIGLVAFDGQYFNHNVSSSAQRGPGEPNVWEDVAEMLAQSNTPQAKAILEKAIDQCEVTRSQTKTGKWKQNLSCKGIYPFLLGVLAHAPQTAKNLQIPQLNPFTEPMSPGRTPDGRYFAGVTPQQAKLNREYNAKHDIRSKFNRAELLASVLFYGKWYKELYPQDKQRIDSLIAKNKTLNEHKRLKAYAVGSSEYESMKRHFNTKILIMGLGSVFDYCITLLLVRDVGLLAFKVGALAKGLSNAMKVRKIVMTYKTLPNSFAKAAKITEALKAKQLGLAGLQSYKVATLRSGKLVEKAKQIHQFKSDVMARFREANAAHFDFTMPQAKQAFNLGETYNISAMAARVPNQLKLSVATPEVSDWQRVKNYFKEGGLPWRTKEKGGTQLNTHNLTMQYNKKVPFKDAVRDGGKFSLQNLWNALRGKIRFEEPVYDLSTKNGVLYINNKMAKTFKAYLPTAQAEELAGIVRAENLSLGYEGVWVKLIDKTVKPSWWEKHALALNKNATMVPLYDAKGAEMLQVGLNAGFKHEKLLLNKIQQGARLVFKEGKIFVQDNDGLRALANVKEISIPKTVFSNMSKGEHLGFFDKLFTLEKGGVRLEETKSKLFFPMMIQVLSYSAASGALAMTLEEAGWSALSSTLVSFALPYVVAPLSPLLSPLVRGLGARNVMLVSLGLATGSLVVSIWVGDWAGHGMDKDAFGNIRGNKTILIINAVLLGAASTGRGAASGVLIKGYETSSSSMTASVALKSIGAASTSIVPAVYYRARKEDVDFSATYPFFMVLTVLAATGLLFTMPAQRQLNFSIGKAIKSVWNDPGKLWQPYKILNKKEVWPYVFAAGSIGGFESYLLFKGFNAWERDRWNETGFGLSGPEVKLMAVAGTAIPQFLWRWGRLGKYSWARKDAFGKGFFNSSGLMIAGGGLFLLPLDEDDIMLNLVTGVASGLLFSTGSSNIGSYNKQLMRHSVSAVGGNVDAALVAENVSSLGNVLLVVPAIAADKLKADGATEVGAIKSTASGPFTAFGLGAMCVLAAEKGFMAPLSRIFGTPVRLMRDIGRVAIPAGTIQTGMNLTVPTTQQAGLMLPSVSDRPGGFRLSTQPSGTTR